MYVMKLGYNSFGLLCCLGMMITNKMNTKHKIFEKFDV